MRSRVQLFTLVLLLTLSWRAASDAAAAYPFARETANPTALDRYVAKPDLNYHWELVDTEKESGLTSYTIDLTSQQWRTAAEVDRPIWKHWLTISVPDTVAYSTAFLFIDGGRNNPKDKPRHADGNMKRLARETQTIVASIFMIPNQPLVFSDMKGWGRSEDALIAYTWDKFLRTGGDEWPARLPMTKAVVRAMDTIQAFCPSEAGGKHSINDFVVAGGSKRGWTTWTTGIVDTRVRAIIPCSIDLVNLIPSFHHHYQALGDWSIFIGDYLALGVLDWLDTPENAALMHIIDPYYYLNRLTMPKLIMCGANDQFFVPDSSQFYWNEVQNPKWIRYIPNAGHGLIESEAYATLSSFYQSVIADKPIPSYAFSFEPDGSIVARLMPASNNEIIQPSAVKLWQAHNPTRRDFRYPYAPYTESPVEAEKPGEYRANVAAPESGWTAYLIELTFPGPTPETPFKFTSGIRVAPDKYPAVFKSPSTIPKGFLTKNK